MCMEDEIILSSSLSLSLHKENENEKESNGRKQVKHTFSPMPRPAVRRGIRSSTKSKKKSIGSHTTVYGVRLLLSALISPCAFSFYGLALFPHPPCHHPSQYHQDP